MASGLPRTASGKRTVASAALADEDLADRTAADPGLNEVGNISHVDTVSRRRLTAVIAIWGSGGRSSTVTSAAPGVDLRTPAISLLMWRSSLKSSP
jgi:hypothetical protein